jgi:DNA-directed RNA polymerase specialized sigma24 family protein
MKHFESVIHAKIAELGVARTDSSFADLYSDGTLALWRAFEDFDPTRGPLEPYLCLCVGWRIRDGVRARSHVRSSVRPQIFSLDDRELERMADGTDLEAQVVDRDLLSRIVGSDPRFPVVAAMRAVGESFDTAAAAVGTTRGTIRRALERAREDAARDDAA